MPDRSRDSPAAPQRVTADRGSVAAGGDISNSPITFGLDEAGVRRVLQEELARIAEEKGVPIAPLRAVLEKLGAAEISAEEIPERLTFAADELIALRQELNRLRNDRPELAAIRDRALALIDAGDLDAARAKLGQGRAASRTLREEASRNEAEFLVNEARIDHLQLAYRDAAQRYSEAADLVGPFDHDARWQYALAQASELRSQGEDFGDNQALHKAIDIYRRALAFITRERAPLDWASIQNNLGNVLGLLGERKAGIAMLEEAAVAYHEALKEWTRDRVPTDWATIHNNLGNVLSVLGKRESGTARLKEAVAAFHLALMEHTRERAPLRWAMTQNNLGTALQGLGERVSGTEHLDRAVAAYREALKERTRERVPREWAMTQNNLAVALSMLGKRESGTARLEEAVDAYRAALQEITRERLPFFWAMTQNNLGSALSSLGERGIDTARLEEALVAYNQALSEWTRERAPLDWAAVQNNIGNTLYTLGTRESGTARLEEAAAAYRLALTENTRENFPFECAVITGNLGETLRLLAERRRDLGIAQEALAHIVGALEMCRGTPDAPHAISTRAKLADALALVARLRSASIAGSD